MWERRPSCGYVRTTSYVEHFVADGGFRAVSGIDAHFVAQREQVVQDRTNDPRIVAARQIRASDAFAEEGIAREEALRFGFINLC